MESMYSFSDVIEARGEDRGENISAVKSIREWVKDSGGVPETVFSRLIHITLAQFKAVVEMLKSHNDWDDKKIAKEIDWLELA